MCTEKSLILQGQQQEDSLYKEFLCSSTQVENVSFENNLKITTRFCLGFAYFAETKNFLMKVL